LEIKPAQVEQVFPAATQPAELPLRFRLFLHPFGEGRLPAIQPSQAQVDYKIQLTWQ
jgi:hypothetical protein